MSKFMLIVAATAAFATASNAQMAAQSTTAKPAPGKTMMTHTATHTTKSGKTIKYDCSKKGNANKKACKK